MTTKIETLAYAAHIGGGIVLFLSSLLCLAL